MIDDVLVPTAPAVSFRAVRMSFDAEPVLEGIDLEQGEFLPKTPSNAKRLSKFSTQIYHRLNCETHSFF